MVKNPYYQQNNGRLPSDPPNYLGNVARETWRKIIPFLESTQKVERIDTFLVETYCTNYEIYKLAYEDIKEKKPTLLLDLHEAVQEGEGEDALGNSLICQSIEETGDLILELLAESESGRFSGKQLTLYGSAPPGSINRVVTEELGIPVITVETFREEVLEQRIENQLEIAGWILKYYGLQ